MTRRQRGFTLVEVMVSLVISALLVGMVLALFSRMTLAYRGQQGVAELQQILAAGQALVERDARQAGHQIPDGFFIAADQRLHQPVEVLNDAAAFGPDELHFYYADSSAQARVNNSQVDPFKDTAQPLTQIEVDDAGDFVPGDLIVLVKSELGATPNDTRFHACVVQIERIPDAQTLLIDGAGTWGTPDNDQCDGVRRLAVNDTAPMVYRFRMRGYRIDPNRLDLAVLQMSPTAGWLDDWQDLAVGFTDLQVASRWFDGDDPIAELVDTADVDTLLDYEWYSDVTQNALSASFSPTLGPPYLLESYNNLRPLLIAMRVSLVVRTHTKIDIVPSQRTPKLRDDARIANNDLGDRDYVQLEGVADASRPLELRGNHVYRYATVGIDLRNLVGK